MIFAPEGLAAIALTGTIAATVIATSVWRRSWPLWLLGYAMLLVAAWVALTVRVSAGTPAVTATSAAGSAQLRRHHTRLSDVVSASMPTPVSR